MKTKNMPKWKTPMITFGIFFVFILALFLKYCYLALFPNIYGINMKEFASRRNTYSQTLYSKRGTIYDNTGNTLALDISSYTVIAYLDPARTGDSKTLYHVEDKENTAKELAPILNMDYNYLLKLLNQDAYQVELGPGGRGITEITKNKIEELHLPGIGFIESYKRYYPNGDFASYIIGYAKQKEEYIEKDGKSKYQQEIVGEMGIEVKYNDILKGSNGYLKYQQDRYGYKIPDTKEEKVNALNGSDIYLTIDSNIQRILETTISKTEEKYEPEWVTISVMDAKTGDILGSASSPSFDPNTLNITNYENPLTSFVYEPGSVMKIFTYLCAISQGTYKGDELYQSGNIKIEDRIISDWNKTGWGKITFDYGFEMSSNVAVSNIMQRFLTKEELKTCLNNYGFGSKTGIDLPRELSGTVKFEFPVEVAAAAYGQGISTTPIQQLQALSIIANNGKMLKPHIISKIVDSNTGKVTYERKVEESEQIVSEASIKKIQELMYNTVNDVERNATGVKYRVEGASIMGKTGTAEIFDNKSNTYLTGWNDYIFSFSGIFPSYAPQYIVFVSIKKPNTGTNAAVVDTTKPLLESLAKYKGIISSVSSENTSKIVTISSYVNKEIKNVKEELKDLNVLIIGDGDVVVNQYPKENANILSTDTIYLLTNSKEFKMPNLKGFSRIEVLNVCNLLKAECNFTGDGVVVEQSIKENEIISEPINFTLKQKHNFE